MPLRLRPKPITFTPRTTLESVDHLTILNIGVNDHVTIDTHIADGSIHFTALALNDLTDVTLTSPATGAILYKSAGDWLDTPAITIDPAAAVSLNFNAVVAFETDTRGAAVTGSLDADDPTLFWREGVTNRAMMVYDIGTNRFILQTLEAGAGYQVILADASSGDGGSVNIVTGDGQLAADAGGDFVVEVGQGAGTGASGNFFINTLTGSGSQGGSVSSSESPGLVSIYGVGFTGNGQAGNVEIWGGYASGTSPSAIGGDLILWGGSGGGSNATAGNAMLIGGFGDLLGGCAQVIGGTSPFHAGMAEVTGGAGGGQGDGGDVQITGGIGSGSIGDGGGILINGGAGGTTGPGGDVTITGGVGGATSGESGDVILLGATSAGNSEGGNIGITAGNNIGTVQTTGGEVLITAGNSATAALGAGGPIVLTAGDALSDDGDGGDIILTPGAGTGTGSDGTIIIDGALNHDGSTVGFYGTTPTAVSSAYTRDATIVEDRTLLQSSAATTINNNNVLAALIADLQSLGLIA